MEGLARIVQAARAQGALDSVEKKRAAGCWHNGTEIRLAPLTSGLFG